MVILYSTGCPKCKALARQLDKNNIKYELVTDRNIMIEKGFNSAPKLEIDGEILDYMEAVRWTMNGGNEI